MRPAGAGAVREGWRGLHRVLDHGMGQAAAWFTGCFSNCCQTTLCMDAAHPTRCPAQALAGDLASQSTRPPTTPPLPSPPLCSIRKETPCLPACLDAPPHLGNDGVLDLAVLHRRGGQHAGRGVDGGLGVIELKLRGLQGAMSREGGSGGKVCCVYEEACTCRGACRMPLQAATTVRHEQGS